MKAPAAHTITRGSECNWCSNVAVTTVLLHSVAGEALTVRPTCDVCYDFLLDMGEIIGYTQNYKEEQ